MNVAKLETIASELAYLRGQAQPPHHGPPARAPRAGYRAPSPNEDRNPKRFHPQTGSPPTDIQPWGSRPRIASVRGRRIEAVASVGHSKLAWAGAFCLVGAAIFRAANHLGYMSGPVVVHLVWPV